LSTDLIALMRAALVYLGHYPRENARRLSMNINDVVR
jgi:hypothetical protein